MNVDSMKVINSLSLKISELVKTLTVLEVENTELKAKITSLEENVER